MKQKNKITIMLILSLVLSLNAFAQYEELVGKWVKVNGPCERRIIGIAFDPETCDRLNLTLAYGDREDFDKLLESCNMLRVENHASAMVLDVELFEGRARIVILSGMHKGFSGWVPLNWLDNNSEFPTLSKR